MLDWHKSIKYNFRLCHVSEFAWTKCRPARHGQDSQPLIYGVLHVETLRPAQLDYVN